MAYPLANAGVTAALIRSDGISNITSSVKPIVPATLLMCCLQLSVPVTTSHSIFKVHRSGKVPLHLLSRTQRRMLTVLLRSLQIVHKLLQLCQNPFMPFTDTGQCYSDCFCIAGFGFSGKIDCLNQLSLCAGKHLKTLIQMVM